MANDVKLRDVKLRDVKPCFYAFLWFYAFLPVRRYRHNIFADVMVF